WGGGICTKCEKSIRGAVFSSSPLLFAGENGTIILPRVGNCGEFNNKSGEWWVVFHVLHRVFHKEDAAT
ncbi:hypothetical protein, partial [Gemmiger sp.]|uniref:hypothetical protein n=1 Tax=Gemmiger sp. TaxID=2049027 RepID=UPI003A8D627C